MSFPVVDRYSQMIRSIVGGPFYESLGIVIPLRSGMTQLRLETTEVQTEFGVYINDNFSGTANSGLDGSVTFSRKLPKGEVIIECRSRNTGRAYRSYVTVRDWANWLAAYASCLEDIDDNINQVRSNMSLRTAEDSAIQDIYGSPISFYRDLGQGVESYRDQVYYLRSAYRNFGGTYKGLDEAVSAITNVDPVSYSRKYWGPNWIPDQSMLVNHTFTERSSTVAYRTVSIPGVALIKVEADVVSTPSTPNTLEYNKSLNSVRWKPDGLVGQYVFAADGELFLPGPKRYSDISILGRLVTTTYTTTSLNNKLYLNLDERGISLITLPIGSVTPASVASLINSTLSADPRYNVAYGSTASVYNNKLKLTANDSVQICSGPSNAAGELFGVYPGDLAFDSDSGVPGVELLNIVESDSTHYNLIFTGTIQSTYISSPTSSSYAFRWKSSNAVSYGGYVSVKEPGYYSLYDSAGHRLNIYVDYDMLPSMSSSSTIDVSYNRTKVNDVKSQGIWIVVDQNSLPSSNTSAIVDVYDDVVDGYTETPDYWFVQAPTGSSDFSFYPSDVVNYRLTSEDPCSCFKYRFTDTSLSSVSVIGHMKAFPLVEGTPRGSSSPLSIPGFIYDYEGYKLRVSSWILSMDGPVDVTLKVSFNGGDTWLSGSAVTVNEGTFSIDDPVYVELELPISSLIKYRDSLTWEDAGVLFGIDFVKAVAGMDLSIDFPNAQVKYISSGYLGNATVLRNTHRQYMEDLVYVWSKIPLTLTEKKYLGLPHSSVNKIIPYSGVLISQVSNDTPVGNGVLEYIYSAVGSVKKLRWVPYGTSFGTGVGYVIIPADGQYTLTAPDGSYLVVDCTYSILPVLDKSVSITVADETTYRGQTRSISPCYTSLDIHDVSEYNLSGDCKNLVGVIGEDDFSLCGLVNCDVAPRDPFKYSFAYPEFESPIQGETLVFTLAGLNRVAPLSYYCDQDQVESTLYSDGVPVPNDWWSFSAANEVSIPDSAFSSGNLSLTSVFTIDYHLVYQVTSTILELNTANPIAWQDYCWWADYSLFNRYESIQGSYKTTTQLFFNVETGRATLINRSDANKSMSKLFLQQAQIQREIPKSYWRFLNDLTIEIDLGYYVDGQYFLEHNEQRVYEEDTLTVTFEHRSGDTPTSCVAASWEVLQKNEAVNIYQTTPHPYHQLRISVSGIRDLSDFRIRSMVLKGLNLRGTGSIIPGLTTSWLGA